MAEELLERVRREIHERKQAAQAAYEESGRLERALAALGPASQNAARERDGASPRRRSRRRRARARPGANRERILALARERPGVTAGEIAEATGIARSTVTTTLTRLVEAGEVESVPLPGGRPGFRLLDGGEPPLPQASDAAAAPERTPAPSG